MFDIRGGLPVKVYLQGGVTFLSVFVKGQNDVFASMFLDNFTIWFSRCLS